MLSVTDISKSFPLKKGMVLSDISFSVMRGEAAALVGENGAGKTTLIRILSQILKPDAGHFSLNNILFSRNPEYIKSMTGTLFTGDGGLYDRLTAEENIRYYAQLNGVTSARYSRMLEILTDELSLKDFLKDKVSTFSRGMKQRTAIARTLITDPELVILDEPSTGLDIIAVNSVKKIISRLKNDGKAVIFSSHSIDEIFSCSDRIIVIHKGEIICNQTTGSFVTEHGTDLAVYIRD